MNNISFTKASKTHQTHIFKWLSETHVMEFWDNSQEHKDDIVNFLEGRKQPSDYTNGRYHYWIALIKDEPFGLIMTIQEHYGEERPNLKEENLSSLGNTYSLDFMIGDPNFIGQGLASPTLISFLDYFRREQDNKADTFFIDPDLTNPKAKHVYEKAGFEYKGDFSMPDDSFFAGQKTHFLVKHFKAKVSVELVDLAYYPIVQNMARFYVYDASRYCGHLTGWELPDDGMYESFDFKSYFTESNRKAYIVKVNDEIAGFVLLNQEFTNTNYFDTQQDKYNCWNIGEFYILAKFQRKGIGNEALIQILNQNPGLWELTIIPENKPAIAFWKKSIQQLSSTPPIQEVREVEFDSTQPFRVVINFSYGL